MALNEWLKLMLEEIRRKQREREEVLRERERRASGKSGNTPGTAPSGPADPPGTD
jgi:hypothetical protein